MITVQSAANFNLYLTQNYLIQQEIRMFINRPCACVRACVLVPAYLKSLTVMASVAVSN